MELNNLRPVAGGGQKIYIETYGCQMNVGDTEIVVSIMQSEGYLYTEDPTRADIIFINTCSVREGAEQRVWGRLKEFKRYKKARPGLLVGVIGCMAERLREELMERERIVDIVAGPDAYRDLPRLVRSAGDGARSVNVHLSQEETYAEISPVRLDKNGVSAFIAIMRGCNNMCSYCVVPFTRGRERSRDAGTILREVRELFDAGYREVTLLGQNVNSYMWEGGDAAGSQEGTEDAGGTVAAGSAEGGPSAEGARGTVDAGGVELAGSAEHNYTAEWPQGGRIDFAELLRRVASIDPRLRVRFATSHPKDLSDKVLEVMVAMPNICRAIHLPAQSGSTRMLSVMNRKYTREWYLERMAAIRRHLPDCAVSTDLIAGFCGESDDDHRQTLSLMREVGYDFAYMFKYSERPDTRAARTMADDVPDQVKTARLTEIIALQNELSLQSNQRDVGQRFEVLVEGVSKRSDGQLFGRTSQNKVVVFDRADLAAGDYVTVEITGCSSATLQGRVV